MCCLRLCVVDVVACCVLIVGAVRSCVLLVAAVADAVCVVCWCRVIFDVVLCVDAVSVLFSVWWFVCCCVLVVVCSVGLYYVGRCL